MPFILHENIRSLDDMHIICSDNSLRVFICGLCLFQPRFIAFDSFKLLAC